MKNKNCTFYIVRHGETIWNTQHRIQGHLDSPLTKKGIQQGTQAAEKLRNIQFNAIFSSDLLRAKRTAEIIKLERNLEIITTEALRERSWGEHDGKVGNDFRRDSKDLLDEYARISEEEKWKYKFGNKYESNEEIIIRFITFLREIAVAYSGKNVLITTHSNMILVLLAKLGYIQLGEIKAGIFKNAGYIIVESDGVDFFLKEAEGIVRT